MGGWFNVPLVIGCLAVVFVGSVAEAKENEYQHGQAVGAAHFIMFNNELIFNCSFN